MMSTPERQQYPGEHGYGSARQESSTDTETREPREHSLEDLDNDSEQEPPDHKDQRQRA
jgi:hypothetical protein